MVWAWFGNGSSWYKTHNSSVLCNIQAAPPSSCVLHKTLSLSYYYNVYSTWVPHPPRYIGEGFLEAISVEDCYLKWPYTVRPCPLTSLGCGDLSHPSEVSFVTNGNHRNLIQGGIVIILCANVRIIWTSRKMEKKEFSMVRTWVTSSQSQQHYR